MNKNFIIIGVVVLAALGGYFFLRGSVVYPLPLPKTPANSASETKTSQPQDQKASSPAEETVNVVTYSDVGYTPKTITIKAGESIMFKNQSPKSMWPASAKHPTHRDYPTTGGCIGSTFDACRGVPPGESWAFTFDIRGSWKYHNHLNPGNTGTVVVE